MLKNSGGGRGGAKFVTEAAAVAWGQTPAALRSTQPAAGSLFGEDLARAARPGKRVEVAFLLSPPRPGGAELCAARAGLRSGMRTAPPRRRALRAGRAPAAAAAVPGARSHPPARRAARGPRSGR